MDKNDPSRFQFFNTMKRAERERLERYHSDPEERKRWILKVASGGGMQHPIRKKKVPVTLAKMSWDEKDE